MWMFLRSAPTREHAPRPSPSVAPSRARRRRVLRIALAFVGLLATSGVGLLAMRDFVWGAPREVVPGLLYRSAQLSPRELDEVVDRYGIRYVVSLRKFDPPAPELRAEIEHLDARGIRHDNVAMSPTRLPKPEALAELLSRFDHGPYPLMLHCEEGVDRTGLATVVWLVVHAGRSLSEARARELSLESGYFAFGQAHAMDEFFELYESSARGQDLRSWILDTYPRLYGGATTPRDSGEVLAHDHGS